jgi:hypothetical protein
MRDVAHGEHISLSAGDRTPSESALIGRGF